MSEKIVGYALLSVGLVIILFAGFSVFQVFTNQSQPVQLFTMPGISIDMRQLLSGAAPELADIDLPPMDQEIVSAEMVNKPLNLFAHVTLMGFIAGVGFKLAQLGVMLVRTITAKIIGSPLPNGTKAATKE